MEETEYERLDLLVCEYCLGRDCTPKACALFSVCYDYEESDEDRKRYVDRCFWRLVLEEIIEEDLFDMSARGLYSTPIQLKNVSSQMC